MRMGQFGNPVKANDAPNLVARRQLGDATSRSILAFHKGGRINIERQKRIFQQKMEELTNALMRFMMDAEKTRLVNIEHTHNVFMQRVKFELKVRVGRDVHAKTRMFRLIFYDNHGGS